jgi:outer membrane lipoprotein-sorting protein
MQVRTRSIVLGVAGIALTCAGLHAEDAGTDPIDILKKADAATKAVDAVEYESEVEGVGDAAKQMPKIKAKVTSQGNNGFGPKRYRIELEFTKPGEQAKHLTVGTDGDEYYVIDHDNKKAYVDIDPAVTGRAGQAAMMAVVREFGLPKPFSDEINGKKVELRGACNVAGEEGYEIYVAYANDMQEAVWCFSKTTYLPRKCVDIIKLRTGDTRSSQRTITKLRLLAGVNDDTFKPHIPEGYTKVDDFYPN